MAAVRSRNTGPELIIRRALHARGFRYRLHDLNLPGKPDIVLRRFRAVVLVHGCFWHGHDCPLFRMPRTRREFWEAKIGRNRERDVEVREALHAAGWRSLTVWECAIRGTKSLDFDGLLDDISHWLQHGAPMAEFGGIS